MGQSTPIRKRRADADQAAEDKFRSDLARWFKLKQLPDPDTPPETWDRALELLEARLAIKH